VVSLTFNDGKTSQFQHARKALRDHRMNGTFYLSTQAQEEGRSCCISWQQAATLYREGDEIGGSTLDHVDLTRKYYNDWHADYAYKQREVCADWQRLVDEGFDPRSFAYPAGTADYTFPDGSTVQDLVEGCGYLSGRLVGGLSGDVTGNALPPDDAFAVRTPAETGTAPLELSDLQQSVRQARTSKVQWVPLVFNEVCHAGDAWYATCMSTHRPVLDTVLSQFLDWLTASGQPSGAPAGVVVRTMRNAMDAPAQPPLPVDPTYVSLTFDDADRTQWLARTLLQQSGLHATFFANTGLEDAPDGSTMTWEQLHALAADGNEIGGHTLHHVDLTDAKLTADQKRHEVCDDRQRLIQQGFNAVSFAYPYGAYDKAAEALVKSCGYLSARSTGGVAEGGDTAAKVPPGDPYGTLVLENPDGPIQLADLKAAVTRAAANGGGWVQVLLHRVCSPGDPSYAACMTGDNPITDTTLAAFLQWLTKEAPDGTTVRTVSAVTSLGAPSGLHVEGKNIVDNAGRTVRLLGFNNSGAEFACIEGWGIFDGPNATRFTIAEAQAMRSWTGANVVRVPLNEQCWLGLGVPARYGGAAYRDAIHGMVTNLEAQGFSVLLDLHRSAPGTAKSLKQEEMPDRDHSLDFWRGVAVEFGADTSVLFDLFNEPHPYGDASSDRTWSCWRDGGCSLTSTNGGGTYVAAGMQELVDAVRGTGAQNVLVVGGIHWAEVLDRWREFAPKDPLNNIVAGFHNYAFNTYCNSTACYDSALAGVASAVPLFAAEIGANNVNPDCKALPTPVTGFSARILDWLDRHGASYAPWSWNAWKSPCALITDYNTGAPTPGWGQEVKARLAANGAEQGTRVFR
jgi:peptidoglycan/xylan/chitin deacetylase (PgdA/CDA1 family)